TFPNQTKKYSSAWTFSSLTAMGEAAEFFLKKVGSFHLLRSRLFAKPLTDQTAQQAAGQADPDGIPAAGPAQHRPDQCGGSPGKDAGNGAFRVHFFREPRKEIRYDQRRSADGHDHIHQFHNPLEPQ